MSIVAIIGAGMMGSAMCFPLRDNGHDVYLVGTELDREIITGVSHNGYHPTLKRTVPDGVMPLQVESMPMAISKADIIISGVSSFGVDWFAKKVMPLIPSEIPVLSVTKGLAESYDDSLITFPELLANKTSGKQRIAFSAIGGPCTSYELADRNHSWVTFCGYDIEVLGQLKKLLETDYYHVSLSTDVIGLESAVALKNAYALAVTLIIGLKEMVDGVGCREAYNPQAALFGQSIQEMRNLVNLLGGTQESVIAGAADLYVTIFGGRTRKLGILLGRGLVYKDAITELAGVTLESVVITTRIAKAIRKKAESGRVKLEDYPLLIHVDDIINQGAVVDIPWDQFANR